MNKIAIHSVPRSGSTWVGSIFDSHPQVIYKYQPLFSYKFKGRLTDQSTLKEIEEFYNELAQAHDDFIDQADAKRRQLVPSFKKAEPVAVVYKEVRYHHILNNLLSSSADVRLIGIIRNPLAVIYSWLNAPKEFRKAEGWTIEEEWLEAPRKNGGKPEEFNGYLKWKQVALLFHQFQRVHEDRFLLVNYTELLKNPIRVTSAMFNFAGLTMPDETANFLEKSHQVQIDDAYSVFKSKSKDNDWEGKLPDYITNYVQDDLRGTDLAKYIENGF